MMAMKSWDLMMEVQIFRFEIYRYLPQENGHFDQKNPDEISTCLDIFLDVKGEHRGRSGSRLGLPSRHSLKGKVGPMDFSSFQVANEGVLRSHKIYTYLYIYMYVYIYNMYVYIYTKISW